MAEILGDAGASLEILAIKREAGLAQGMQFVQMLALEISALCR